MKFTDEHLKQLILMLNAYIKNHDSDLKIASHFKKITLKSYQKIMPESLAIISERWLKVVPDENFNIRKWLSSYGKELRKTFKVKSGSSCRVFFNSNKDKSLEKVKNKC